MIRSLIVSLTAFAMAASCMSGASQRNSSAGSQGSDGACGRIQIWSFPRDMIVTGIPGRGRTKDVLTTQARVSLIAIAAEEFCRARGEYPQRLQQIKASTSSPAELRCAIRPNEMSDAWGHPIYYGLSDGVPIVVSAGADGQFSSADDVALPLATDELAAPINLEERCRSGGKEE